MLPCSRRSTTAALFFTEYNVSIFHSLALPCFDFGIQLWEKYCLRENSGTFFFLRYQWRPTTYSTIYLHLRDPQAPIAPRNFVLALPGTRTDPTAAAVLHIPLELLVQVLLDSAEFLPIPQPGLRPHRPDCRRLYVTLRRDRQGHCEGHLVGALHYPAICFRPRLLKHDLYGDVRILRWRDLHASIQEHHWQLLDLHGDVRDRVLLRGAGS